MTLGKILSPGFNFLSRRRFIRYIAKPHKRYLLLAYPTKT